MTRPGKPPAQVTESLSFDKLLFVPAREFNCLFVALLRVFVFFLTFIRQGGRQGDVTQQFRGGLGGHSLGFAQQLLSVGRPSRRQRKGQKDFAANSQFNGRNRRLCAQKLEHFILLPSLPEEDLSF